MAARASVGPDDPVPSVSSVTFHAEIAPILETVGTEIALVAVDMPTSLPDHGQRASEVAVRSLLGPRRASMFMSPPAAVLDLRDDFDAANARCRDLSGKGLSRQAFHLLPKIVEVDAALRRLDPGPAARVWEAHPELAFARRNGAPMAHPKRTAAGVAERLVVLEDAGIDWRPWVVSPPAGDGDDVIDALVLTLTAADLALGLEVPVFDDGPTPSGRPSRITG